MLILTRKSEQSIMIGDEVEIMIVSVSRTTVQLGIRAPRDIPVFRKEIHDHIEAGRTELATRPGA